MFLLDTISEFILFTFPIRMVSYPSWTPSYHRSWCPDEWWRNLCVSSRSKSPTECRYLRETYGWSGYGIPYYLPVQSTLIQKRGTNDIPAVGRIDRIESHRTEYIPGRHLTAVIIPAYPEEVLLYSVFRIWLTYFASSTADLQNYRV